MWSFEVAKSNGSHFEKTALKDFMSFCIFSEETGVQSQPNFLIFIMVTHWIKLQALVYDILPSTTAVFSYAIGPRKLSANEQFFVGAQTVVSLLQTTHIRHLFYN